jgi:hypothetical protein
MSAGGKVDSEDAEDRQPWLRGGMGEGGGLRGDRLGLHLRLASLDKGLSLCEPYLENDNDSYQSHLVGEAF